MADWPQLWRDCQAQTEKLSWGPLWQGTPNKQQVFPLYTVAKNKNTPFREDPDRHQAWAMAAFPIHPVPYIPSSRIPVLHFCSLPSWPQNNLASVLWVRGGCTRTSWLQPRHVCRPSSMSICTTRAKQRDLETHCLPDMFSMANILGFPYNYLLPFWFLVWTAVRFIVNLIFMEDPRLACSQNLSSFSTNFK